MVFKIIHENKIMGFSYYPAIEIGLGIFLLIMSFLVPIISFKYNGFKTQPWGEWLFCIGFFLFFFLLGKSLTFQSMKVEVKNNRIYFRQDMRLPAVILDIDLSDWEGQSLSEKEENGEKIYLLNLKTKSDTKEFYQTKSNSEVGKINDMLNILLKETKGEQNETK